MSRTIFQRELRNDSGAILREVQERLGSDHLALTLFPLRGSLAGDREEASRAADVPVLSRPCQIEQWIESRRQRRDEEDRHDELQGYPSAPLWLRAGLTRAQIAIAIGVGTGTVVHVLDRACAPLAVTVGNHHPA